MAELPTLPKKAGELWKAMEDKSEWEEKAAEEKRRYEAEYKKMVRGWWC